MPSLINVAIVGENRPGEGRLIMAPFDKPIAVFNLDGKADHEGGHSVSAYETRVEGDAILVGWLKPRSEG